ncbi:PspC domain-containing protein [Capnocytophaga stomatis]
MLVPPARTTSEKLEMQGKSVTIDTLSTSKNFDYSTEKKLYRSSQNRMLGGVLSGLSEYYSLQTTWVRIIFVIALLGLIPLLNISFLLLVGYIVLWIIVPEKPVFFEERSNHFDENHSSKSENDFVKDTKIDEKETKQTSDKSDKVDENPITVNKKTSRIKQTRQGCWGFIRAIFKGILYVIVGFVVLILLFVFLSLFLVLLGVNVAFLGVAGVLATMYDYLPFLFNGSWQLPAVYIALGMLLFVAICVPTLVCIRLFSSTGKNISKNWVIANVLLFFIGTIMILVVIGNTARDFRYHRSVSKSIPLENISDTLKINMESMDNYGGAWNLYVQDDGKAIIEDNNWVEIKRTKGTPFLEIWTSSQGANGIEAKQNAEKIDYPLEISGNTISIPKYYILDKNSKFRMQKVTFLLNIPDNVILTTDSNMDTFFEGNYYWLKKDNHYRIHNDSLVNTATNLKEDNKRKEIRFHSRGRWHKQRVD